MPINITKGTNLNKKEKRLIMGLAPSQVNFLALTARKSDIGYELQRLSSTEEALTRDMQKVTRDYKNALSTKTLKWSGNSGVTYTDLNYSTLMSPGATNDNTPLLITNASGQVVLSDNYKKYAEMITQNGGKYDGDTRYNILSELVGVSADTIKSYDETAKTADEKNTAITEAFNAREAVKHRNWTPEQLVTKLLSPSALGYSKSDKLTPEKAQSILSGVQNALCGKNYFSEDVETKFKTQSKAYYDDYASHQDNESYKEYTCGDFVNSLATCLQTVMGSTDTIKVMIDEKNDNKGTQADYEAADAVYKQAQEDYKTAVGVNAQVLDSSTERKIEFYDKLFQAVADMGWAEDSSITDTDYLNQTLQNNTYYITTMTKNNNFDEDAEIDDRNYKFFYDTEFAENDPNIFKVNNSAVQEEALVKYEYEKSIINEKEKRISVRMKNLETEQAAISKMLESIDKIKNENIERTFKLWS